MNKLQFIARSVFQIRFRLNKRYSNTDALAEQKSIASEGDDVANESKKNLLISFNCNICNNRVTKNMSKRAYYHGVVVIHCSGCKNNHLIADRLGWFDDKKNIDIEKIMKEKGQEVVKLGMQYI